MAGQPKVIFLDAVGTLFGVKDSVGAAYSRIAQAYGVSAGAAELNAAFYQAFADAPKMAFPDSQPTQVPYLEYMGWYRIAEQTFAAVHKLSEFADFDAFFTDLYRYFETAEPWELYPETVACLQRWHQRGIELGVISNFDSRLYQVLEVLGLGAFFHSITISSEVGVAKPDPLMFTTALHKHDCVAAEAWHVGDSYQDDVEGAKAAGLAGIWLQRA